MTAHASAFLACNRARVRYHRSCGAAMGLREDETMDRNEAIKLGEQDGVEDVDTVLEEQGLDVVLATLKPGHVSRRPSVRRGLEAVRA